MERIKNIQTTDKNAYLAAKKHWDGIAKPLGSFGLLEEIIQKIAAVQKTPNVDISKRCAVIFCGDHGVTKEGVSQCGSVVTALCAAEIAEGRSNVNALAKAYNTDVIAVDVGIADDMSLERTVDKKINFGTRNFTKGSAMSYEQTERAVIVGMDIAGELKRKGVKLMISGEMGIGNTTSAAALASVLLELPPEKVTGRGAGLSSKGLKKKIAVIKKAIKINKFDVNDPLSLLAALGGYETAAMTGLFLGGAYYGVPVIIDGVVSAASAAIAYKIDPLCAEYMLASHCSAEPAAKGLLDMMGLRAVINAELRLGEGTGGLLLVPLIDGALALYNNSHSFEEAKIERYVYLK